MKILYVSQLEQGCSARARMLALQRMGHQIVPLDTNPYATKNRVLGKLSFLLAAGPNVQRLNRDILRLAAEHKPDLLWADKVLQLQPATVLRCRALGIQTVCYMIDNAFGPRRDSGLRLYKKAIPCFDLHCTQRDVSVADLKRRGARQVIKIQTAYDPIAHFPPPDGWSDADRDRDVSFIGSPYDDRAEFLTQLSQAGFHVVISGAERAWQTISPSRRLRQALPRRRADGRRLPQRDLALQDQSQLPHQIQPGRGHAQELRDRRLRRLPAGRAITRPSQPFRRGQGGRLLLHRGGVHPQDRALSAR